MTLYRGGTNVRPAYMVDFVMPIWNLGLRFVLELAAFGGFGYAAWRLFDGGFAGVAAAVVAVVVAATVWGVFAVPGDPSRGGGAPVPVPGWLRLLIELAVLIGGALCYALAGAPGIAIVLAALIVVHHIFAVPRLRWLMHQKRLRS